MEEETDYNGKDSKDSDCIMTIRSQHQKKLIKQRFDDEKEIDILLSGTSATIVI